MNYDDFIWYFHFIDWQSLLIKAVTIIYFFLVEWTNDQGLKKSEIVFIVLFGSVAI